MGKSRFTEIRLKRLTDRLDAELEAINAEASANVARFENGEQTANRTLRNHRELTKRFNRICKLEYMALEAANRIDNIGNYDELHELSEKYLTEVAYFHNHPHRFFFN